MRRLSAIAVLLALFAVGAPSHSIAATGVKITKVPGTVVAGKAASVSALTAAGVSCTIKVVYKTTVSKAKGLEAKKAAANGVVSWTWTIGTNTTKGTWPVTISCQGNGAAKTTITVK
jgi:micrococcal nuclease